jgi:hypothetical protein
MIEALANLRLRVHMSKAQIWPVTQGTAGHSANTGM